MITKALWKVYETSFPACERREVKAYDQIVRDNPEFIQDVIYDQSNAVGIMFHWETEQFSYLEHFAIDASCRNCGVGGRCLDAYIASHSRVVLEVDPPEDEISCRRIEFYKRHGLSFTGISFTHPGYGAENTPYTLYLMTSPMWTTDECEVFLEFLFSRVLKKSRV